MLRVRALVAKEEDTSVSNQLHDANSYCTLRELLSPVPVTDSLDAHSDDLYRVCINPPTLASMLSISWDKFQAVYIVMCLPMTFLQSRNTHQQSKINITRLFARLKASSTNSTPRPTSRSELRIRHRNCAGKHHTVSSITKNGAQRQ